MPTKDLDRAQRHEIDRLVSAGVTPAAATAVTNLVHLTVGAQTGRRRWDGPEAARRFRRVIALLWDREPDPNTSWNFMTRDSLGPADSDVAAVRAGFMARLVLSIQDVVGLATLLPEPFDLDTPDDDPATDVPPTLSPELRRFFESLPFRLKLAGDPGRPED